MKKVIVISNFHEDASVSRSNMTFKYFSARDYETIVLYSSFSHSLKKFRYIQSDKFIAIESIKYKFNTSFKRILSHLQFSFKVFKYLRKSSFDIIYVILPPNMLALAVLLNRRKKVKIIIDIIDLWTEAFPHNNNFIRKFLFYVLGVFPKYIRTKAIVKSDYCITESDLYFKKLGLINKSKSKTIYLKKFQTEQPDSEKISDIFSIVYLGNLGNAYDFKNMFNIIKGIEKNREVFLHVIGSGPMGSWFFESLNSLKINYKYYGASFDEKLKQEVLPSCWFGFNGYKQDTEVALSYKSIDYLSYGVPLLNSAKEDTHRLVISEKVGFNFNEDNLESLIALLSIISKQEVIEMKKNAYTTFQNKFSGQSYYTEMDEILNSL